MKSFISRLIKNRIFKAVFAILFWIAVWYCIYFAVGSDLLFSSPFAVVTTLFGFCKMPSFWGSVGLSLLRIALGYLSGVVLGTVFALICHSFGLAKTVFSPLRKVVRATPVVSFIVLAWLWIARGIIPVFISALMVFPIIWESVATGLDNIPKKFTELADVYRFSFNKRLKYIVLPSIRPYFASAAVTSLGLAWKSGIAAEVLCQPALSVGAGIYNAKTYLETGELFAWTTVVIILSILLEKAVAAILKYEKAKERGKNGQDK